MEPEDLPEPEDLWWSWVVLAALHRSTGDKSCWLDADTGVLHLEAADGSWIRMQRSLGSRATLWGRSALAPDDPADAGREAPDWAVSDATRDRTPSFLAWHAHGEWDTSSPCEDEGAVHLLRPMLTVDPRAVESLRRPGAGAQTLERWTDGPHLDEAAELLRRAAHAAGASGPAGGAVQARLREQVHQQMRESRELDRMLIQRPPTLVQWSRVNGPRVPFEHAVMVVRHDLRPAATNTPLAPHALRTLSNVLAILHREESAEESGAWLFARVWHDGRLLSFDRAFDAWPPWFQVRHVSQGPSLPDLAWEMKQRSPQWRPAWARLLPIG